MMMMIYESRPDPGLGKRVYADTQCLVAAVCCRHSHGGFACQWVLHSYAEVPGLTSTGREFCH
jgi:hypothetical protein